MTIAQIILGLVRTLGREDSGKPEGRGEGDSACLQALLTYL